VAADRIDAIFGWSGSGRGMQSIYGTAPKIKLLAAAINKTSIWPAAALAAEIARHPISTRRSFMGKLDRLLELIGAHLPSGDAATRRWTAMGSLRL
jgi:hypothetical protein